MYVCKVFCLEAGPSLDMHYLGRTYLSMGGSPGDASEEPAMLEKRRKGRRMNYDAGKATEGLENESWCRQSDRRAGERAAMQAKWQKGWRILHHPTPLSNPSIALPTSQPTLQTPCCPAHITAHSPTPPLPPPCHRLPTHVTRRAVHVSHFTRQKKGVR